MGATGIQVGTPFAFCEESGVTRELKQQVLSLVSDGKIEVFTDPLASPTGFPFKIVQMEGTYSDPAVCERRERICDLGYLRTLYRKDSGKVGYRCPGEPEADFVEKGGNLAETVGRTCLCNGLLGTIGLAQVRNGELEPAIVTAGDDVVALSKLIGPNKTSYSAKDVLSYLLSGINN